jgi:hypothetical protein
MIARDGRRWQGCRDTDHPECKACGQDGPPLGCYQMLYCGRSGLRVDTVDLAIANLRAVSSAQAKALGVSGALVLSGDRYVQLLEGTRIGVESMFKTLRRNSSHVDATLIAEGPIGFPQCFDWSIFKVDPTSLAARLLNFGISAALDGAGGDIARLIWLVVGLERTEYGAGHRALPIDRHERVTGAYV